MITDAKPFRQSLYKAVAQLEGTYEKEQASSKDQLEINMRGAENVVYFHNDYFAMTGSKEQWLQASIESAKNTGVKKFIAVAPIEYEMYYTEGSDIDKKREEAWQKAQDSFPGMTILRPNIVFGAHNYALKFMQQSIASGSIPSAFKSDAFTFKPVHHDAVARAIDHALDNSVEGLFGVKGQDHMTFHQMFDLLAE